MRRAIEIALILTVAFLYVNAEEDTGARISLPEYRNRLDSLVRSIENHEDLETLAKTLPSRWTIVAGDRQFVVFTETIRSGLVRAGSHPAEAASSLIESLKLLQVAALQYESAQPEHSAERTAIRNILARREFSGVAGTSWFDRLKNRVQRWLFGLLERILGRIASSSAFPVVSKIIVWTLIGIAVIAFALWAWRNIKRAAQGQNALPNQMPVSAKDWVLWLGEEQAAAAQGRWRDAVHLAYWTSISRLESEGVWRPDRARTPREYLKLLPQTSTYRSAMATLTKRFEITWYGAGAADERLYRQMIAELEQLGCR